MNNNTNSNSPLYYANYSIKDFDSFDCVKLSKGIYLSLLFVLRGYIAWIMSVTNMRDKTAIIQWLYPDPALFYLSLISGVVGLYLLLIISLRRPDAASWIKTSWRHYKSIIIVALLVDLVTEFSAYWLWQLSSITTLATHTSIAMVIIYFTLRSKRIKINVAEFPEKLPEP